MKTFKLPISADLSVESFIEAKEMLAEHGKLALVLVCSGDCFNPGFQKWLWENSRITGVQLVPAELLKMPNAWALGSMEGFVVMEGF